MRRFCLFFAVTLMISICLVYAGEKSQDESKSADKVAEVKVYVTSKGKKYHVKGCKYIKNKTTTEYTVSEAKKKGYEPCKVCKPSSGKDSETK